MALANRDLAIVYSYSGQLEKAEEFAREAMRHQARDPRLVTRPGARRWSATCSTRRGDFAGAVLSYDDRACQQLARAMRRWCRHRWSTR
jgi:hypothetical protein